MDKKVLLRIPLAQIMNDEVGAINNLLHQYPQPEITMKPDGSPVTTLDLALSQHVESFMQTRLQGVTFYSEEKFEEFRFPLLALDPLDGTREYIEGRSEWTVSAGLFENGEFEGEGWVYNPVTGERFEDAQPMPFVGKESYLGEVSRSEWKEGLFTNKKDARFLVSPMGSIAYKLGRLSQRKCDFVVSLRPKNIWDIAGGSLLCKRAGMKFYSQGREVKEVRKVYLPPLIWCPEEIFSELSSIYPPMDKHL